MSPREICPFWLHAFTWRKIEPKMAPLEKFFFFKYQVWSLGLDFNGPKFFQKMTVLENQIHCIYLMINFQLPIEDEKMNGSSLSSGLFTKLSGPFGGASLPQNKQNTKSSSMQFVHNPFPQLKEVESKNSRIVWPILPIVMVFLCLDIN